MKLKAIGALGLLALLVVIGLTAQPAQASTSDFSFASFEADYYLSRTTNHTSHMQVDEQLVAVFPVTDQNHGILRALPAEYEHHGLSLKVQAVTDEAGHPLTYSQTSDNGNTVLKIGDADRYVHGRQTYRIHYDLDNVTTQPSGFDGLFWDVNGDQWDQSFDRVTARVHLPAELATSLQPAHTQCFTGVFGSTASACNITVAPDGTGQLVTARTTQPLTGRTTLTYQLGFADGTFAGYIRPPAEQAHLLLMSLLWVALPLIITLAIVMGRWWRFGRDAPGRSAIVPEYLPPQDMSVLAASAIWHQGFKPKAISAQIIDLAVRHYLKIDEVKEKKLFKDVVSYELELLRLNDDLAPEEIATLNMLFGPQATVHSRVKLRDLSSKLYETADRTGKEVNLRLTAGGYFQANPETARWPFMIIGIILIAIGMSLAPWGLGIVACGLIFIGMSFVMPARAARGVTVYEYLQGLQRYMKLAEAERLRVLQSPHGSLTEKVDVSNTTQMIKLYERLLPYAMLFGFERDWAKEFAHLYQQPPDWYGGANFNALYFASSLSSFGTITTTSFSPPSSSSGGGSAGGGGGGGGGGGW